jgi:hypothetical protein
MPQQEVEYVKNKCLITFQEKVSLGNLFKENESDECGGAVVPVFSSKRVRRARVGEWLIK